MTHKEALDRLLSLTRAIWCTESESYLFMFYTHQGQMVEMSARSRGHYPSNPHVLDFEIVSLKPTWTCESNLDILAVLQ